MVFSLIIQKKLLMQLPRGKNNKQLSKIDTKKSAFTSKGAFSTTNII